jgi:uncharacterized protein YjbI with pentapeptide repeats
MTFAKWVTFSDATFAEGAHFYRVGFREGVEFTGATFTKHVRFSRSSMQDADSHSARFLAGAVFLIRANKLALTRAKVSGDLTIEATASAIGAVSLRGAGRFTLRLRAARVDLSDMVFDGPVTLRALQRPLDWDESGLSDPRTGCAARTADFAGWRRLRTIGADRCRPDRMQIRRNAPNGSTSPGRSMRIRTRPARRTTDPCRGKLLASNPPAPWAGTP